MTNLSEIEKKFKDKALFELSLTHRSWINESEKALESNERLEFLGDAILEFVVSSHLYGVLPGKEEGFLTALRSNIVNTRNLAAFAKKIDLGKALLLSKGEEQGGGRKNESLLANTVEALIGAIFLDQGLLAVSRFIEDTLLSDLEEKLNLPLKDPKSRLQELVQAKGYSAPRYQVVSENGPDHAKLFKIAAIVNGETLAVATGKSKNIAEQKAAESALAAFSSK